MGRVRAFSRALSVLAVACGVLAGSACQAAWAASDAGHRDVDDYTVAVSPAHVSAGATVRFTILVGNSTRNYDALTSARIAAPAGFRVRSVSLPAGVAGNVRVSGDTVTVSHALREPGQALRLRVVVTTPLRCGTLRDVWRSRAWEGAPGAPGTESLALVSAARRLITTVSTTCSLRFATEPHSAQVGQPITGADYAPSAPPVAVEVVDRLGTRVRASNPTVSIALATNPGGTSLSGTATARAAHGLATFTNLSLGKAGDGYTLAAAARALHTVSSTGFDENQAGFSCAQDQSCTTVLKPGASSSFQVLADPESGQANAGSLTLNADLGTPLECSGYTPVDSHWYGFEMSSANRSKTVTYTLSEPYPGAGALPLALTAKFCFGASYEFTTSAGTPAPAAALPDGSSGFIGVLPACPASGPCLVAPASLPAGFTQLCSTFSQFIWNTAACGITTLVVDIPAGLAGDPWGRA